MTPIVYVSAVVGEMQGLNDECFAFLNRITGELCTLGREEIRAVRGDGPERIQRTGREHGPVGLGTGVEFDVGLCNTGGQTRGCGDTQECFFHRESPLRIQ